jgi:hypothetical protein
MPIKVIPEEPMHKKRNIKHKRQTMPEKEIESAKKNS